MLNTGRLLEHWHTGSMTRRSFALDAISPRAEVYVNPEDAAELGLVDGGLARVTSRRGTIVLHVKVSHRDQRGNIFIPFHFREAAANLLTIDEIDPSGKIPEFKFCAVAIAPADDAERTPSRRSSRDGQRRQATDVPGVEARAGKFPGPSLIPALKRSRRHGWLPREELEALARQRDRPLYEIEGLISFYPHFRTEPPRGRHGRRVPRPRLLAAGLRRADRRDAGASTAMTRRRDRRGLVPGTLRHRAGRHRRRAARRASTGSDELVEAKRGGDEDSGATVAPGRRRLAQRSRTTAATQRYQSLRDAARRRARRRARSSTAEGVRPARHGRRGLPDRQEVGAGPRRGGCRRERRQVRDLQRRRVRAGHLQGPPDPRRAAAPGARGHAAWGWS